MDLFGLGDLLSWDNLAGPFQDIYDVVNTERNWNAQKSNTAYQRRLQRELFAREDNAVRRRAADLKAAGFNPLLAAGGAASAGQAVSTTAPHADRVDILANAKMAQDISMTKAQQELLNSQRQLTNEQKRISKITADLNDITLQWYKDHPGYAPNVESGVYTGKGLSSIFDNVSNRFPYPVNNSAPRTPKPVSFDAAFKFYKSQGMSDKEATGAASRAVERGKQQRR